MGERKLMLLDWMRKVHQLEYAHCYQSIYYSKIERYVGIAAFCLSTVAAFSYRFPIINDCVFKEYILPLLLLMAALLTGYQTFIKPGEKANVHRKIGIDYEFVRHEMESIYTGFDNIKNIDRSLSKVKSKWDSLNTLHVDEKKYKMAKDKVKSFKKYPEELGFLPNNS